MEEFYERNKALFTNNSNEWETPQKLFDSLNSVFHFTLDPCSTDANAKCEKHYTQEQNGLEQTWEGETVFCNPPYGRHIGEWVRKCAEEAKHARIVMLIPARTDTTYFHEYIYRQAFVQFIRKRLKFELGGGFLKVLPHFPRCLYSLDLIGGER